jgi:hypothetical protein
MRLTRYRREYTSPDVEPLVAGRVGFETPRGCMLPLKVEDLMPLTDSQPRVSQYRPGLRQDYFFWLSKIEEDDLPASKAVLMSS